MIPVMKQGQIIQWDGPPLHVILQWPAKERVMSFVKVGRIILNMCDIIKVVRDGKAKTVTVYSRDGVESTFKDNAEALWDYLKSEATDVQG